MDWNFKIAVWNANGLVNHGPEISVFLKEYEIDILLISETHFTNRSYLKLHNYIIYDTKHPDGSAHGGSAVIIRRSIKHHEACKYQTHYIQATTIVIEDSRGPISISAIYCPPRHTIKERQYTEFYATLGSKFLVGGDYNAKHPRWGSRLTTPKGRELEKCIVKNNLNILSTGKPTYWPSDNNKIPDVIDFCVTKNILANHLLAEQNFDLSSDHSPVMVTLSSKIIKKQKPATLVNKRTNWELFRTLIEDNISTKIPLKTAEEIDSAVENITRSIQQASWNSTPELESSVKQQHCSKVVKDAIAEKRKLRKRWMVTRHRHDKEVLNKATRDLKELLHNERNRGIREYLEGLTPTKATDYSLWKATAKLKGAPQANIPPVRKKDRSWARTDREKAIVFAEHLAEVFQPFPSENCPLEERAVTTFLDAPFQMSPPIKAIKSQEVVDIIKKLDAKKAPGYDLITGTILKQLPSVAITALTQIFNAVLRTSHFPSQWKVAQIILVLKPGKPAEETTSYRPISLLPILSKMFEKLFFGRLKQQLDALNIVPDHQFGFRENHATIEQVHRVVQILHRTFEEKKYCSAAFLDITQAFDKVWHPGLLYKLKKLLPATFYQVLKSYLSDRYFMVKYQEEVTGLYPIKAGVPQGSVLGPALYLIFTADIPTTPNTTITTFADDTAILATSEVPALASEKTQEALDSLQGWLKRWRIKANEAKSQHVTFTLRTETCPSVTLNGQQLPRSENAKYLGMHLDQRLNWKHHIFSKRKQLGLKFSKLYWLIGRNSKLSLESKITIYKVILKPIWTYGVQLWGTASVSNLEILQRFQSKALRTIADAPWFVSNKTLHQDFNIPTVMQEAKQASSKYLARLEQHPNSLAVGLLDNSQTTYRLKRLTPLDLSYR